MRENTFQTTISGADGQEHLYQTIPFTMRESVEIQLELGRILGGVAGPVVEFASTLFSMDKSGISLDMGQKGDSASAETLGRAVVAIPEGIMKAGGYDFMLRVMRNTSREVNILGDGHPLTLCSFKAGDNDWVDRVYPGGNFREFYEAFTWVLTVNFSPFGRGPSWSWSNAWKALSEKMPMLSIQTIGTPQQSEGSSDG
jgi:hypothetical protein